MDIEQRAKIIDALYDRFPEEIYKKTLAEIAKEIEQEADNLMEKRAREYKSLNTFKEKQNFYSRHKFREYGYKLCKDRCRRILSNPTALRYESWIDEIEYEKMKKDGYRQTIKNNFIFIT